MKKWVAFLIAASLPSAIMAATPAKSSLGAKAKNIIADRLVDPSSLVVRNTHLATFSGDGQSLMLVCGEYNSKNRFGGYVGFREFVYEPAAMKGVLTLGGEYDYDFFSENGSGDFIYGETDAQLEAAAAAGRLDEVSKQLEDANHRYAHFAMQYFPECLGHS
jgi:hypothetical protein